MPIDGMCSFVEAECEFKLSKNRRKSLSMFFLGGLYAVYRL